ncbi:MAG: TIM barrel protein [Verrucomicrobiaceae bacterium]|jgi:sugar phosphate isomerase/epimerase|nr:TIM barrel protein [Verrucomicrobiaceae bacterium]
MKKLLSLFLSLGLCLNGLSGAEIPESAKVGAFYAGCQAYSFRMFSVMEAIEKTAQAGGKTIEFYPGQKLSVEQADVVFKHGVPEEVIAAVKAKLAKEGVTAVAYGVVRLGKDDVENRKVFAFAKTMGIGILTTEPDVAAMDQIEALVKEFDIKIAIHNHPRKPLDRSYLFWDPNYVLGLVKDRDARMGACADTGHWVRSGLDPVECVRILKGRIFDSHLKDLNEKGNPKAHDVPYGTGVSDVTAILNAFVEGGFYGPVHTEYEYNWENSVGDITKCLEFVKAFVPAGK